jgi:hypothetical protein
MCLSSRIIMVLAWIHRTCFVLCVVLQVGSLWRWSGAACRRCTVEQEERPLVGQAWDGHVHQLALGQRMGPDQQLRRVGIMIAAPLSARERGPANRIGEWRQRALSSVAGTASC